MDFTQSDSYDTDAATGHRLHQDTAAVPTVFSAKDANSVIWSLMEIVLAGGQTPAQFNPAVPSSYKKLKAALDAIYAPASGANTRPGHTYTANDWANIDKPQGLILQFGSGTAATGNGDVVTLPFAFPNQTLHVIPVDGGSIPISWGADTYTISTFKIYGRNPSGYSAGLYRYIAIGR